MRGQLPKGLFVQASYVGRSANNPIAITVDDRPEVMWSVDNPGYLLMSRLSEILVGGLAGSKSS
jgi:hypothetical protein